MISVDKMKVPEEKYIEEFDIKVRPYLLIDEIYDIGEKMLACDSTITQKCVMILSVLDYTTNIPKCYIEMANDEEDEDDTNKFLGFDLIILSGLWDAVEKSIVNIYELYDYVANAEDMSRTLSAFIRNDLTNGVNRIVEVVDKLEKKMPKGKQLSDLIDNIPKSLKEALDTIKEDGNAEIIDYATKMAKSDKE